MAVYHPATHAERRAQNRNTQAMNSEAERLQRAGDPVVLDAEFEELAARPALPPPVENER